jgi:hypothetical protein
VYKLSTVATLINNNIAVDSFIDLAQQASVYEVVAVKNLRFS